MTLDISRNAAHPPLQPDVRRGAAGQRVLHRQRDAPRHVTDTTGRTEGVLSSVLVLKSSEGERVEVGG